MKVLPDELADEWCPTWKPTLKLCRANVHTCVLYINLFVKINPIIIVESQQNLYRDHISGIRGTRLHLPGLTAVSNVFTSTRALRR